MDAYRDDLFILFPILTSVISTVAFAVFATPLTLIALKRPAWSERYRIQQRAGQGDKILLPSIGYSVVNGLTFFAVVVASWPLLRLTGIHSGPLPAWYVIAGQVVFFVYLDDLLFYCLHRVLHTSWLYKRIHAVHHRFSVPWAIAAHYMHPIEYVLIAGTVFVGPILLGSHIVTIWIWVTFRQWEAAEGHCGYDFPWNPSRLFPLYEGSAFHDYHHSRFVGNYAGFAGYLDRLLGTRSPGYEQYVAAKRHSSVSAVT